MQRLDFRAMGCQMLALSDSDNADATEALTQVPVWFAQWEASLSRFRDESELNALNRADGKPMRVSNTIWQVIDAAIRAAQASQGLVTPTTLDALRAAGYDRDFESIERSSPQSAGSVQVGDWRQIERNAITHTVRLPRGLRLDFGGIAKGWAADQAAQRLSAITPALIDAGGDIALSGARANGEPWSIGIADPFKPESNLELLMVDRGGVATSGRDYRRWQRAGKWQHHIIDPRTGAPAETDVLSATVIAPTTLQAEVAAKTALILGSEEGMRWIESRNDHAGLLVLENGQVVRSRRMDDFVWSEPVALFEQSVFPSWS